MHRSVPRLCTCRSRRALALQCLALFLAAAGASALQARPIHDQKHESRRAIDQLEDEWRAALLTADTAQMTSLLADDYMGITANGILQTKDETLAGLSSGRVHFTTLDIFDRKIRLYGNTAVVTSRAEVQASTPEGALSGSYWYTRVYAKNPEGQWKIVSFEASRIREPVDRTSARPLD